MDNIKKSKLQKQLIEKYKSFIKRTDNADETYKWFAVDNFQQHWDLDAEDFTEMFKRSFKKIGNLLYLNTLGFLDKAVVNFPSIVRSMFIQLYDETQPLDKRIRDFQQTAQNLLPEVKKAEKRDKLNHQQDERAISVYLSLRYPGKYYFYMFSFYEAYCKLLDLSIPPTNDRYIHFLTLAEDFKKEVVLKDAELIEIHKKLNSGFAWDDTNLIVQNIFYRTLKAESDVNKILLANITWNSNGWKEPSDDKSVHKWVAKGGQPHESWNFDFENKRNPSGKVLGYAQFTKAPLVKGTENLILFYSQNKIVGLYGKAEILKEPISINKSETYNLIGDSDFSLHLANEINDVKEKGYLGEKLRVGQIGYSYLNDLEIVNKILDEASELNPEQFEKLGKIRSWLNDESVILPNSSPNYWIFQGSPKIFRIAEALKDGALKTWSIKAHNDAIKPGDKVILWVTGEKAGCYALCRVTSEVELMEEDEKERSYYVKVPSGKADFRVRLDIEFNFWDKPVLKEALSNQDAFQNFFGGNQGTNFIATKMQYETIKTIASMNKKQLPLNQILYGPPGTGKTYNTINEAIKIVDPEFYDKFKEDRKKLRERFSQLKINDWKNPQKGQISFCTFHQSFSYEDFIEGIKPVLKGEESQDSDGELKYRIEDGIFKLISNRARHFASGAAKADKQRIQLSEAEYSKAQFYKISLGDINVSEDKAIYDYCIENSCIAIGFMETYDLTGLDETRIYKLAESEKLGRFEAQAMSYFNHYLKTDNYIVVSKGNRKVRAIGKVTGNYYYKKDSPIRYTHFRDVQWIVTGADIPVEEVYEKAFSQQSIYKLNSDWINKEFFVHQPANQLKEEVPNFVLIIDEINRGNISQIFGELITLIEPDKRAGGRESLEVTLPYSKEEFSIPSNLFLIGTMNTADRSIEALDTALRRRFTFIEMAPNPTLIPEVGKSKGKIEEIDLVKMLEAINNRIEKLIDKDHMIGHSYFLDISDINGLREAFRNKIIPLLEEYFYGDFGKIGLVLGEKFVNLKHKEKKDFSFAQFGLIDQDIINDLSERKVFEISGPESWNESCFISIYQS